MNPTFNLKDVFELIEIWDRENKVGKITINFFKGGITNVNINETLKAPDLVKKLAKD